jgi:hypothetical protein
VRSRGQTSISIDAEGIAWRMAAFAASPPDIEQTSNTSLEAPSLIIYFTASKPRPRFAPCENYSLLRKKSCENRRRDSELSINKFVVFVRILK